MSKLVELIKEICLIPSPSGFEERKAEFIRDWLIKRGALDVCIDEAKNVVFKYGDSAKPGIVFMAHIDTVFSLETPLEFIEEADILRCPSVGDNSANAAGLMLAAEYLINNKTVIENHSIIFVFSSGEEGLGNLKGCRHFMQTHENVCELIAVDGGFNEIVAGSVGSHRFEVSVRTAGGHSFNAFGNDNAIHIIARIIKQLYEIEVPKVLNSKTTYNVGTVKGGTTVNSIAGSASMLYEYRSDDYGCLMHMKQEFERVVQKYRAEGYEVDVVSLGERPCAKDVNPNAQERLLQRIEKEIENVGEKTVRRTASMDCNIPLSMGIPSAGVGVYIGKKEHSKDEFLYKNTLENGYKILLNLILSYTF